MILSDLLVYLGNQCCRPHHFIQESKNIAILHFGVDNLLWYCRPFSSIEIIDPSDSTSWTVPSIANGTLVGFPPSAAPLTLWWTPEVLVALDQSHPLRLPGGTYGTRGQGVTAFPTMQAAMLSTIKV